MAGPRFGIKRRRSRPGRASRWNGRPKATIDLVVSETTLTAQGTDLSSFYIIDNNLAPVDEPEFRRL